MNYVHSLVIISLIPLTLGCQYGPLAKRHSELNCPTDIRQLHVGVAGEDAVMWGPCGVTEGNYGHQPTCWRTWPMSVNEWRATRCPVDEGLLDCPPGPEYSGEVIRGPELPVDQQNYENLPTLSQ